MSVNRRITASASAQEEGATIRVLVVPENIEDPVRVENVTRDGMAYATLIGAHLKQPIWGPTWTAWCDESGMLRGRPVNLRATLLMETTGRERDLLFGTAPVQGTVLFCGEDNAADGWSTSVTDEMVEAALLVDEWAHEAVVA